METNPDKLPTIADMEILSPSELKTLYTRLFLYKAPSKASIDFLRGTLAWQLQALTHHRNPGVLRQQLITTANKHSPSTKPVYKPGTRLVREWQGQTYEVTMLENGYRWRDQTYRSLSQIAQAITGSHWSGPRFFGLT